MNVSMPIAAVLLDLDFPAEMIKAIPILARTGGLLAHLAEEQQRPIGFLMASHGEAAIAYDGGRAGRPMILDPEVETRPWAEQRARRRCGSTAARSTISSRIRASIARSSRRPASRPPEAVGGLDEIAKLPFTEKDELRATRSDDEPIGTHLAAPLARRSCASSRPAARPARRATFR